MSAVTVKGEVIIENLEPPEIKLLDLLETVEFELAYALAALLSYRQKDYITSSILFSKSVFYGALILIILQTKRFPLGYKDIYQASLDLDLDDNAKAILSHAMGLREGKNIKPDLLYKNITFLNQIVYPKIKIHIPID